MEKWTEYILQKIPFVVFTLATEGSNMSSLTQKVFEFADFISFDRIFFPLDPG